MRDRISKAKQKVDVATSDEELEAKLLSKDPNDRLVAILTLRKKIELSPSLSTPMFEAAKKYLTDSDSDCKWQAFISVSNFMATKPDECWEIIKTFGNSEDQDTRAAVATVLLEHYFEINPHLFDEKFRDYKSKIADGHRNLLATLKLCRSEWGNDLNNLKVQRFLKLHSST